MRKTLPAIALFLIALALLPLVRPPVYFLSLIFKIFLFIILSESWTLIGGFAGYVNLGHIAFFGIGTYTSAMLFRLFGVSPFIGAVPAGCLSALVAVIVGYPCLRIRGPYFVVITMCFASIVDLVVKNWPFLGGGTGLHLPLMPLDIEVSRAVFYEVFLGIAITTVVAVRHVQRSKFGLGLASIREDEDVAQTLSMNSAGLKIRAFALSAFFAGVAGGVYAYYISYVHPDIVFDMNMSVLIVLMALFGGPATWSGPLIGAVFLSILNEILSMLIKPEIARIIYGSMFMAVIIFMPDGVVPYLTKRLNDIRRRGVSR
jgi:branched-chain amino acid transport system permease protein